MYHDVSGINPLYPRAKTELWELIFTGGKTFPEHPFVIILRQLTRRYDRRITIFHRNNLDILWDTLCN